VSLLDPGDNADPKLVAFFLPQFHPFAENDRWWGKGFTEWSNVTKAVPQFPGHYQPRLPTDLGFYDLRLRETRREQIALAKQYGIDGFCYHFYWFSGKRLMERPLDDMLADPDSDMPFCLCWANENWTRRWDAAEHDILIRQDYAPGDDERFIDELAPFFRDPRYIRVDGKPFLIVYRPQQLPDAQASYKCWQAHAQKLGFPGLHVCAALTHGNEDYTRFGFDCGIEFPPHNQGAHHVNDEVGTYPEFTGRVMEYGEVARWYMGRRYPGEAPVIKAVFPNWDNTARVASRATIILNGTPDNYELWLADALGETRATPRKANFVFINAWNEWAEGCHLEPDRRFGRAFLEATLRAKRGETRVEAFAYRPILNGAATQALPAEKAPERKRMPSAARLVWRLTRETVRIARQVKYWEKDVDMSDFPRI